MTEQYRRDVKALCLLYPNWNDLSVNDQRAFHHTFMFTVQAAIDAGVVKWPEDKGERSDG